MDFKVPFLKVTLVFQRYFLNRSLIEYLNCDFKELTRDRQVFAQDLSGDVPGVHSWARHRPQPGSLGELQVVRCRPWELAREKQLELVQWPAVHHA